MAKAALFIGWGVPVRGREEKSFQVFGEALQYFGRLQQEGAIDGFEPYTLELHGGDLDGFLLVHGDLDRLHTVRYSDEFTRLIARAGQVVEHFGVVTAFTGQELQQQFALYEAAARELA